MSKLLIQTIKSENCSSVPIWLMRQAGRYLPEYKKVRSQAGEFLNLCYNPKLAAKVTMQPIERFGFDGAILFSDILVIPNALGQKVDFLENQGPVLEKINNNNDLDKILNIDINLFHARLNPVYETLNILKSSLKSTTLIGFAGAPWTVASYMVMGKGGIDYKQFAVFANENIEFFNNLLNLLVEFSAYHLIKQVEAGAEVLQIFDSWAGALEGDDFINFSSIPAAKIVKLVKRIYPDIPIIGFPRGAGDKIPDYILNTKFDCISLDQNINLDFARNQIQKLCPVQGCLSPDTLLSGENLEQETLKILDTFKDGSHIFNLGHGINKHTPIKNVEKLVKIVKNYNRLV